jgi:hypothetical protein
MRVFNCVFRSTRTTFLKLTIRRDTAIPPYIPPRFLFPLNLSLLPDSFLFEV